MCWGENSLCCVAVASSLAAKDPFVLSSLYLRQWLFISYPTAIGKGPIISELHTGVSISYPSMLRTQQNSVDSSVTTTAHYIHRLLSALSVSIHHCSSHHAPETCPIQLLIPHALVSHRCLLCTQLPPTCISPPSVSITTSVSFPHYPLPLWLAVAATQSSFIFPLYPQQ